MIYEYTPSQKFNTIRISVLHDIKKNLKNISYIKEVKNRHFHNNNNNNNNAEKLSTNCKEMRVQ